MMSRKLNVVAATRAATGHALEAIDNSEIAYPEPRRIRDKNHLDLFRPSGASSAAAHLPIPIICALRKAARWDVRSATNGSSHSVEAIIARFIATVTNATGGQNPALTRMLPHDGRGLWVMQRPRVPQ
jgi:hypothetical protein